MKKMYLKAVAIILSVIFVLTAMPVTVIAQGMTDTQAATQNNEASTVADTVYSEEPEIPTGSISETFTSTLKQGDKTLSELAEMEVDLNGIPEAVNQTYAIEKQHVNRLTEQEGNLNTIMYQNKNGSKSAYIFSKPVKYIGTDGTVKDKSSKISSVLNTVYSYAMTDNSIKAYFPTRSSSGTLVEVGGGSVLMIPISTASAVSTYNSNNETVAYNGAFGENTVIMYETELNGIKEDIILIKNIGKNVFEFEMTLTGLTPIYAGGIWYLKNSEQQNVASFGDIIINDRAENTAFGTLNITPKTETGKYTVTITAPSDFLNAPSTVYPVYIDPTISETDYYYNGLGDVQYNSIRDTGIYADTDLYSECNNNHSYLNLFADYAKIIYKLPDFFETYGQYKDLNQYQIVSASLHITTFGLSMAGTMTVRPMTDTWDETVYGENPIGLLDTTLISSYSSSNSTSLSVPKATGEYSLDITNILRGWAKYNTEGSSNAYDNPENGLILSHSATRQIRSTESSGENVYVTFDIGSMGGTYYFNNRDSRTFLKWDPILANKLNADTYSTAETIKWNVEYNGDGKYFVRSYSNNNFMLYDDGTTVSLSSSAPTTITDQYKWTFETATYGLMIKNVATERVLKYDSSVDIENEDDPIPVTTVSLSESAAADYKKYTWSLYLVANYVNITSLSLTYSNEWVAKNSTMNDTISFAPSNATLTSADCFAWKSESPSVVTVDSTGYVEAKDDGYTNIIITHIPTGTTAKIPITVGMLVTPGVYHISNIASGKCADVEGPSTETYAKIQQWDHHIGDQENWMFMHYGNGYYYIKSLYSNQYISVQGSTGAIVQVPNQANIARWRIVVTPSGNYKLVSESSGKVLSVPTTGLTSNGTDLQQSTYTNDVSYNDEWVLCQDYDASVIVISENYDTTGFGIVFQSDLSNMGYTRNVHINQQSMNENFLLMHMMNSKIFAVFTHGDHNSIQTSNEEISVSKLNNMSSDIFANTELIVYMSCETASGRERATNNLVNTTHAKGADTVIGFEKRIWVDESKVWLECFFDELTDGNSIEVACANAKTRASAWFAINGGAREMTTDSYYIAGNKAKTFS